MGTEEHFDLEELFEAEEGQDGRFDFLRFSFADVHGISRCELIPRRHAEHNLTHGFCNFAGRFVEDFTGLKYTVDEIVKSRFCNGTFRAAKGTLRPCAWVGEAPNAKKRWRVGEVLCEMRWPRNYLGGAEAGFCPRFALRRQLDELKSLGFTLSSCFNVEFSVLHSDSLQPIFGHSHESLSQTFTQFANYMFNVERKLDDSGIEVLGLEVKKGPGQLAVLMKPKLGVEAADDAFRLKEALVEMSAQMGYHCTFLGCPCDPSQSVDGSLTLALCAEDADGNVKNAFCHSDDLMSNTFRHFLAGVLRHGRALAAFWAPTVHCYRRFKSQKLRRLDWGVWKRNRAFRVTPATLEVRLLSSAANPYLATAAMLAAGIDGIANELSLPHQRESSLETGECSLETGDCNLETGDCSFETGDCADEVPLTLDAALDALKRDVALQTRLGGEAVATFVELKRHTEVPFFAAVSEELKYSKERDLYLRLF